MNEYYEHKSLYLLEHVMEASHSCHEETEEGPCQEQVKTATLWSPYKAAFQGL